MKKRIYYNHTDAGGVVYHTNYIIFCEQARSEMFFKNGIYFQNCHYVVKELNAKYLKPARLGDEIQITTKLKEIKKASIVIHQEIILNKEIIFELEAVLVFIKDNKISRIPKEHIRILNEG
ncbi:MAG: acyl-CoA thioesterase [Epsilonproteobacteria bacterium]|nr:acyl-CoA thioesterase [Campylobacterota bacterium]